MREIWKDIPDYEGIYQVSNLGNIKSFTKVSNGHILKPCISKGYKYVCLNKNGKHKNYAVHRLVALAFVKNPYGYKVVNHKDENKLNNNADNLEWCTSHYNFNYGTSRLRQGISSGKPVEQLTLDDVPVAVYYSSEFAAKINNCDSSSIHKCCTGKRKSTAGFHWRYFAK